MGASAAPCSADFDPPRRTAPAERGPRAALRPRPFPACGGGLPDHRPRVTGGGGRSRVGGHCFLALPLAVYVFSWEPSVWSGACIGGGGAGGPRHPAPSRAQEGGREHPRRGWPPGRPPPSCGARSKLLSAARWTNFSRVLGLPFLLPSRRTAPRRGGLGGGLASGGREPGAPPSPGPPASLGPAPSPPPRSRSLRKLRP